MIEKRLSRQETYLKVAYLISYRGTCQRKQVGCVITSNDGRIISTGYNGTLPKQEHCNDNLCDLGNKCQASIHAEANAISAAARHGIQLIGAILYCTTAPCIDCARLIIQSGITEVHYADYYSNNDGLMLLNDNDIYTLKWNVKQPTE